jgi:3-oxoadipate enol-lactonase
MAEIMLGDIAFNVSVEGDEGAPALLIAHSLGSDLSQWEPQMPSLTRRFRVIRYDSRGHGLSEPTPGPYSVEQLGRDALAILDTLKVKKAHFMGLSLGGAVGMWLMINAPERIDRAILANTNACFGHPDVWNARIKQALAEGLDAMAPGTMDRWFTRDFQERAPAQVDAIAARFRSTSAEAYAATAAALRDADQREAIRGIKNRVLVIVGTQDAATPPTAGGLIAEHIPGSRLVALDAAHLSNIEAANEFTRAIVSFLTAPAAAAPAPKAAAAKPPIKKKPAKEAAVVPEQKAAKKAAKKGVKAATKRAAKKTPPKAPKKAAKKSSGAIGKKAAKKTAKKATKVAVKKSAKKAAKKSTKSAAKKTARKTAKKTANTSARKPAKKPARKNAKGRR